MKFIIKTNTVVTVALSIKMSKCLAIITFTEQYQPITYGLPVFRDHYCPSCWIARDYNNEIIKYNIDLTTLIKDAQLEQI